MTTITTKLVKDGNSVAVRLPKHLLALSGLHTDVQMEVKKGMITLRAVSTPRSEWREHIARIIETDPRARALDQDLEAWETTVSDGFDHETD